MKTLFTNRSGSKMRLTEIHLDTPCELDVDETIVIDIYRLILAEKKKRHEK